MNILETHKIKTIEENPLIVTERDKHNYKLLLELFESSRFPGKILQPFRKEKWRKEAFQKFSKFDNNDLRKWIYEKTPLLNDSSFSYTIGTRLYWIYHGLTEFPKCQNEKCGKIMYEHKNIGPRSEYRNFCSVKCINNATITRAKINATKETKYGDSKYNNREQSKKTTKEHYGVDNIFKDKEFIEKQKKLLHENKETRMQHFKENCINKYGVEHPMKLKEIADKCMRNRSPQSYFKWFSARYYYDGVKFDSSYELIFYIYLKDNQISFEYHPKTYFIYKDCNEKEHRYYPDFKIGNDIIRKKQKYIEENIDYFKGKCMKDNHIKVMTENELIDAFEYFNSTYPKDFITKCKIRKSKISL